MRVFSAMRLPISSRFYLLTMDNLSGMLALTPAPHRLLWLLSVSPDLLFLSISFCMEFSKHSFAFCCLFRLEATTLRGDVAHEDQCRVKDSREGKSGAHDSA